ncbi:MAG: hypothetical protein FD188_2208 [Ignavibacteria bacterium]|nr:MAG: hypothetical protein FD188_2208 [Ignavibacteria bacterium]
MKATDNILIKSIRIYLITVGIIFILGLIIVFGSGLFSFLREGKSTFGRISFMGINLIIPPKGIIINPFIDGFTIILIGLIKCSAIIAIINYLYKFFENVLELEVLSKENGKYLKTCGILLSSVTFLHVVQSTFMNINMFNPIANSTSITKIALAFLLFVLNLVLHPLFWLGMFFILFGKIIDMASEVKQENDLTV